MENGFKIISTCNITQKRTPIKNNTKRNRKKHTMGTIQNSI